MNYTEDIDKIISWNRAHAIVILISAIGSLVLQSTVLLGAVALMSFVYYAFSNLKSLSQIKPFGGYANWVTTVRFLILITYVFTWPTHSYLSLGIGMSAFVLLDIVDGWFARKFNHDTFFGQYFDMEIDALFVLLMCCYYFMTNQIGPWILVPGFMRYVYKVGIDLFPKEDFRESKKSYASIIAGTFFVILVLGLFVMPVMKIWILAIGSILIVFSFGISLFEYVKFKSEVV